MESRQDWSRDTARCTYASSSPPPWPRSSPIAAAKARTQGSFFADARRIIRQHILLSFGDFQMMVRKTSGGGGGMHTSMCFPTFASSAAGRWRRKDLGAVLQHYGIRTPWLDVVRNLYTAIWFATHDLRGSGLHGVAMPTRDDYCWISFYRRRAGAAKETLRVTDLSAHHSSTHLRAHAQHGTSLAMQADDVDLPHQCQDFSRFRIAQVRIPNGRNWKLSGHMFSSGFIFPSLESDDSLRLLSVAAVQDLLKDACTRFDMQPGTLGEISSYR